MSSVLPASSCGNLTAKRPQFKPQTSYVLHHNFVLPGLITEGQVGPGKWGAGGIFFPFDKHTPWQGIQVSRGGILLSSSTNDPPEDVELIACSLEREVVAVVGNLRGAGK